MINKNLVVENAKVIFRNFSGKESKFNRAGQRNFCVLFDKETGEELQHDGWNVGILQAREEGDDPAYRLQVAVSYMSIPPQIYLIVGRNKTLLSEDSVSSLDFAEIANVDLEIRPYNWDVNGKIGVKAYVHRMYVTIREDKFAAKYDFDYAEGFGNEPF